MKQLKNASRSIGFKYASEILPYSNCLSHYIREKKRVRTTKLSVFQMEGGGGRREERRIYSSLAKNRGNWGIKEKNKNKKGHFILFSYEQSSSTAEISLHLSPPCLSTNLFPFAHLINIGSRFGRGFNIGDPPLAGAVLGVLLSHFPALVQVGLVAHQQERDVVVVLHAQDLLPGRT